MRAIRVTTFGDPAVMQVEDVPPLTAQEGQVVVEVKAAGVNPVDAYMRSGQYMISVELPYTPGIDAAGVVKAVGRQARRFRPGDRVYVTASLSGTYAQDALCTEEQIFPLPQSLTFEQGAAIGVPYGTAYRGLFTKARALAGETVLIHGASGGVGLAALQLAKSAGITVIATAGTARGLELLTKEGADHAIDHSQAGYLSRITDITQGRGVDIILEMLANVNLGEDLKIAGRNGRIVVIGCRGPVMINPRDTMSRDLVILGLSMMNLSLDEKRKVYVSLEEGFKTGKLVPVVGRQFPLAAAPAAHEAVLGRGAYGKIVLIP